MPEAVPASPPKPGVPFAPLVFRRNLTALPSRKTLSGSPSPLRSTHSATASVSLPLSSRPTPNEPVFDGAAGLKPM